MRALRGLLAAALLICAETVRANDAGVCPELSVASLKSSPWRLRRCEGGVEAWLDGGVGVVAELSSGASTGESETFRVVRARVQGRTLEVEWEKTLTGKNGNCSGTAWVTSKRTTVCDARCAPKAAPRITAGAWCRLTTVDPQCAASWSEQLTLSETGGMWRSTVNKRVVADGGVLVTPLEVSVPSFDENDRPLMDTFVLAPGAPTLPQFASFANPLGGPLSREGQLLAHAFSNAPTSTRKTRVKHPRGPGHRFVLHERFHDAQVSMGGVTEEWADELTGSVVTLDATGRVAEAHLAITSTYVRHGIDETADGSRRTFSLTPVKTRATLDLSSRCEGDPTLE